MSHGNGENGMPRAALEAAAAAGLEGLAFTIIICGDTSGRIIVTGHGEPAGDSSEIVTRLREVLELIDTGEMRGMEIPLTNGNPER